MNNNYPLAPDKLEKKKKCCHNSVSNVKKLLLNFFNKEKCVLHDKNLQFYLGLGLKIKKVHRVLEFDQSKRLKPYIDFNTQKIIEAEKIMTEIEKHSAN